MPLGGTDVQQITLIEKQAQGELMHTAVMPGRFAPLEIQ
jgi:protein-L-isoaspartate O-methyltransferase